MLKFLFLVGLLMTYSAVQAAQYRFVCNVKETSPNKAASAYKIWLEFDIEPRYFKYFIQEGKTLRRVRDGFPQNIEDRRILIASNDLIQEYYDRQANSYFYMNESTQTEIKGSCVPSTDR